MYHRNRLIKPYVRVGYQLRVSKPFYSWHALSACSIALLKIAVFSLISGAGMCSDCHWFSLALRFPLRTTWVFFLLLFCLKRVLLTSSLWIFFFQANNLGVGVVGVIECDFLQPTHNKQDFDYTKAYRYNVLIWILLFECDRWGSLLYNIKFSADMKSKPHLF